MAPGQLNNSGSIKPIAGSVSSPLEMVTDVSVMKAVDHGGNLSDLQMITTIPWGFMWNGSDSFFALNGTAIDLYNTADVNISPSWSVDKLPTGCTLSALVCVSPNYPLQGSNMAPTWSGGFKWASGDANAFYIPPQSLTYTEFYKIVFVLTLTAGAIPQDLNFVITINAAE
jgi:hypothetical protein